MVMDDKFFNLLATCSNVRIVLGKSRGGKRKGGGGGGGNG